MLFYIKSNNIIQNYELPWRDGRYVQDLDTHSP